jgi:hypothetical protein
MGGHGLANPRYESLLCKHTPANKFSVSIVQVFGVKNFNPTFGEPSLYSDLKCLPLVIFSDVTRNRRDAVLRVFAAII